MTPLTTTRFGSGRPLAPIVPSGLTYRCAIAIFTRWSPALSQYSIIWLLVPMGCLNSGFAGPSLDRTSITVPLATRGRISVLNSLRNSVRLTR